jgi:hypothetical protein
LAGVVPAGPGFAFGYAEASRWRRAQDMTQQGEIYQKSKCKTQKDNVKIKNALSLTGRVYFADLE